MSVSKLLITWGCCLLLLSGLAVNGAALTGAMDQDNESHGIPDSGEQRNVMEILPYDSEVFCCLYCS